MAGALLKKTAASPDLTPDAVNWTDMTFVHTGSQNGNTQTISGITAPITLKVIYSDGQYLLNYKVNAGSFTNIISNSTTITVSNGDTVQFQGVGDGIDTIVDGVTVVNNSTGGNTIDTFNVTIF